MIADMSESTLTDRERRGLLERAYLYASPKDDGDPRPEWSALEGYVERIVAEAVDRERAAVHEVLDRYFDFDVDSWDEGACPEPEDVWRLHRDLRALLAADDTEGKP